MRKHHLFGVLKDCGGGNKFSLFLKGCGVDNNSFFVWKFGGCVYAHLFLRVEDAQHASMNL